MNLCTHATFFCSFKSNDLASAMDDFTLVTECSKGSLKAQRALFDKFAPKMLAICNRYVKNNDEAEDVLQDGFVKVFQKIPEFKMEGSLEGWVKRIMINTALDAIRKNKKRLFDMSVDDVQHKVSFTDNQFDNMQVEQLMKLVQAMPDGYRLVFNMFAIEGYSHKEIAETLGITENTSKSQYLRARTYLRTQLELLERD
ncbi:MAG TPA: sigma-70 family RNA polymerase sigma factor [Fluviicola sp.]|nr:sigma-70 family RNA polymerase sigma factor [Fluviicola sp.]